MKTNRLKIKLIALFTMFFIVMVSLAALSTIKFAYAFNTAESIDVSIECAPYSIEALPEGVAGKLYQVFDCAAITDTGESVTDVNVYVYDPEGNLLPVDEKRFQTKTVGIYKILYVARYLDLYAEAKVEISVKETCEPLYYEIDANIPSTVNTGSKVFANIGEYGGGSGKIDVKTEVKIGDEAIKVYETDSGIYFKPEKNGGLKLKYILTDFVGNELIFVKEIKVVDSNKPIIEEPSVAKSAIVGKKSLIPMVDGVLYAEGKIFYCPVKVYFDDEEITNEMAYVPESTGKHSLKYVCDNPLKVGNTTECEIEIEVYDSETETSVFDKYFYLENLVPEYSDEINAYTLKTFKTGTAYFQMASAIVEEYLGMGIAFDVQLNTFGFLELFLTDSKKFSDCVKISIDPKTSDGAFYFTYDSKTKTLLNDNGKVIAEIEFFTDGRKFTGFSSGRAYISCQITDIVSETVLQISSIATQSLTSATRDKTPPMFLTDTRFSEVRTAEIDEDVIVYALKAYDLLDNDVKITLIITDPTGKIVFDGIMNDDYHLKATEYGVYEIKYVAQDSSRNKKTVNSTVNVIDRISPEIDMVELKSEVKIGETIKISEVSATDNVTEECLVYVYVLYGNYHKELVYGDYTFNKAGEYIIRYVAYDGMQNYSVIDYKISCK